MHYFLLKDIQHFFLYLFPAFVCVLLIGAGLAFSHFRSNADKSKRESIYHIFPDGIEDRKEPFPLVLILTIVGTIIWAFFYIVFIGLAGVKI